MGCAIFLIAWKIRKLILSVRVFDHRWMYRTSKANGPCNIFPLLPCCAALGKSLLCTPHLTYLCYCRHNIYRRIIQGFICSHPFHTVRNYVNDTQQECWKLNTMGSFLIQLHLLPTVWTAIRKNLFLLILCVPVAKRKSYMSKSNGLELH